MVGLVAQTTGCVLPDDPKPSYVPEQGWRLSAADVDPCWSWDSRWLVFHRRFPSTEGPAGLYSVSLEGGRPRFIAAGDFLWPKAPRISRDGKRIVASIALQLGIIDVSSGSVSFPMYTDNGVLGPDWSPDGRTVAYSRMFLDYDEPVDSGGVRIFDIATGRDTALITREGLFFGHEPRFDQFGRRIAILQGGNDVLSIIHIDDGAVTRPARASLPNESFYDMQWTRWGPDGPEGILVSRRQSGGKVLKTVFVEPESGIERPWRHTIVSTSDAISPDGRWQAMIRVFPPDSIPTLYVQRTGDATGATRRRLTRFVPVP